VQPLYSMVGSTITVVLSFIRLKEADRRVFYAISLQYL